VFDFLKRTVDSPLASVTLMGFIIAGLIFLVRLETDVRHLQDDVRKLQEDVSKLQNDVTELQVSVAAVAANQQRILDALENIEVALANHTHDDQGQARFPLAGAR
jgi:cell division protein FtsL